MAVSKVVRFGIADLDDFNALQKHLAIVFFVALELQDILHFVAGTADGEALTVEQIADAPEYRPGVTLTAELVAQYMSGQRK